MLNISVSFYVSCRQHTAKIFFSQFTLKISIFGLVTLIHLHLFYYYVGS